MQPILEELKQREADGRPIRVGLIGAGAMGLGIAWQVARTPGMEIVFIGDIDLEAANDAVVKSGRKAIAVERPADVSGDPEQGSIYVTDDPVSLMGNEKMRLDALVEASNTIGPAARYCFAAIERGADVVLMNDSPLKMAEAVSIAKQTRRIVWQNIVLAFTVKGIFILFGTMGMATMWEAVFADMGTALLAVANSTRIIGKRASGENPN